MKLSIVIVSYNTCRLLNQCIFSIQRETNTNYEIIVIDNDSKDGSYEMLINRYPKVKVIRNQKNVGFAKANNQGFAIASGKYYLMLNPDTVILEGALDKLVNFMDGNNDIGICGPRNVDPDGKLQYSCDHFPSVWNNLWSYINFANLFPEVKTFRRSQMMYWDYSELRDVDKVMGSCLIIRSELYKKLNGLDENYFMYFEETDLCYRVRNLGYRVVFHPEAKIIHYGGESSKSQHEEIYINDKIATYYYESQKYFFKKNYGILPMITIRLLDFSYALITLFRNLIRKDKVTRHNRLKRAKIHFITSLGITLKHRDV
jgi:GT2 family glycosyltransferase